MIRVELLHNEGCHVWKDTRELLKSILVERNVEYKLRERLIRTQEEAREHKFLGSPQVKINGRDIDPEAAKIQTYNPNGCRIYLYKDDVYEYPPRELILEALDRLRVG
ncbi:MAG: DUF2703 domain-containing protein [Dehalococcoidia bacterium]|nr:hypothetical protein [Chloroflexota bacterium]MBT9159246.1 hypothetical protein [Chloroflexota bacterium]MBT9161653.1 hypothetical protein [Chloroflexota bacterium]